MSNLDIRHAPVMRGRNAVLEAGQIAAPLPAVVGVVGINGSGKSSLFMHLGGNLLNGQPPHIRMGGGPVRVATMPQEPALPGWLYPAQVARLYGCRFDDLLIDMPGLHLEEVESRRVRQLSVGQRQALAAAITMQQKADLTLLDEPFAALDFRRRIGLLDLIAKRSQDSRSAVMLSSQSAADLVSVCDHFVVIHQGRYAFAGPRGQLATDNTPDGIERRLLELLTAAPAGR